MTIISPEPAPRAPGGPAGPRTGAPPTVWGLSPVELHDRFWAHRGVQVVRPVGPRPHAYHDDRWHNGNGNGNGHPAAGTVAEPLSDRAQLFLLLEPELLVAIDSAKAFETLYWSSPDLVYVRLFDPRQRGDRERVVTDSANRFVRFEREYGPPAPQLTRAALTPDREIARLWLESPDAVTGRRRLRAAVAKSRRSTLVAPGSAYDAGADADLARLVKDLMRIWSGPAPGGPGAVIARARQAAPGVWADATAELPAVVRCVGGAWIGAGRRVAAFDTLIGPTVLWDDPAARPVAPALAWPDRILTSLPTFHRPADPITRRARRMHAAFKRGFDVVFSLIAIGLTLWVYPLICLAIWLEDGRPFFFAHRRETRGGREFGCLKFRSMFRDAERRKQELLARGQNQADGPQFFMEHDVRVTRVGRLLRKTRLDELPQFFNVLLGHMSVVGPRPSPHKENQFCPAWREARLSVRPGITGLWQVKRTRTAGQDFQEWIRYDIEYVENQSLSIDLLIIAKTFLSFLGGLIPWRARGEKRHSPVPVSRHSTVMADKNAD